MKICFLIANISGKGGTERVTTMIANGLKRRQYEIGIITCQNEELTSFEISKDINIFSIHSERIKNPILRKLRNYCEIYKKITHEKYDVVIAVDIYLYLYLLPMQLLGKCKCVAWEHFNYYISSMKSTPLARRFAVKYADKIILLSKSDLLNYKEKYKKCKNLTCIYNPTAYSLSSNKNIDKHRVIAAGRLTEQKGFDMLIEAWALIENQSRDWVLDIYGVGEQEEMLNALIKKRGLSKVFLKGYADNLDKELEQCSIFVLSSRYEGFGLVLIEAQSKGLPCVSFNCKEGPAEIIDDEVNGYLVEPENVEALARKLLVLMDNDVLRTEFSEKSQKDLHRFNIEEVLDNWEEMLNAI